AIAATTSPIFQTKTSAGTATFEVGASGAIVHRALSFFTNHLQLGGTSSDFGGGAGSMISMKNATTAPTTNPTAGVIFYAQDGVAKFRAASGDIFDTTKRTVTGAKGGNAALTSLLTQLAAAGLITNNTTWPHTGGPRHGHARGARPVRLPALHGRGRRPRRAPHHLHGAQAGPTRRRPASPRRARAAADRSLPRRDRSRAR